LTDSIKKGIINVEIKIKEDKKDKMRENRKAEMEIEKNKMSENNKMEGKMNMEKYYGLETSEEVLQAIATVSGCDGCVEIEREVEDETEGERARRIEECKCEFCRIWARGTDEEAEAVKKLLEPGTYYWGLETIEVK